ncbi:hypothetical protein PIB30_031477 [Stylosanthes scabra]|uniref:Uncharacterized protein n=1 Tax=Stylosanthes scabra TaxID=79078 RepID=A0ABU6VBN9_9FABA|nr:hypothetical protein [Stylosanthes scabra]
MSSCVGLLPAPDDYLGNNPSVVHSCHGPSPKRSCSKTRTCSIMVPQFMTFLHHICSLVFTVCSTSTTSSSLLIPSRSTSSFFSTRLHHRAAMVTTGITTVTFSPPLFLFHSIFLLIFSSYL